METKLMKITPPMAREWLKKNTDNRPLRRARVDGMKLAFQRGEYIPTHQGIAFLVNGELADGQHRLTALAEMPDSFAVEMLVTRGLPANTKLVMDIGAVRSAADILRRHQGLTACARFSVKMLEVKVAAVTPQYLIPFVDAMDEPFGALMDYCPGTSKTWSAASVRTAAILRMINGDRDYVLLSYHALNHSDFDAMSPRVKALYRQAARGTVNTHSLDIFARAYRAFDVRGQSVNAIQISDQAGIIAEAKAQILEMVGQKKAATSAAKKVNKGNSTSRLFA